MRIHVLLCSGVLGAAVHLWAADFSRDIAPILMSECLVCHSAEKAKGGYRVHTFEAVLEAGKSKERAVVAGKPEESELYRRLATHDEDDRMPQDDDPLTDEQIELFRSWIAEGAKLDRGDPKIELAVLAPRSEHPAPPEVYPRAIPILALAFTKNGERLAVAGHHEVTFWNMQGKLAARVTNAPRRIHAIAFDPKAPAEKERFVIAGGKPGGGGELTLFEAGVRVSTLAQAVDELLTVAFSPDGKWVAGGGSDNAIRVYGTANWEEATKIRQHADWVTSVRLNADGSKLVSASRDRTARVYDTESGELETTYPNHGAAVSAAVFLAEDKVASGGKEKEVHLWETQEGKKTKELREARGEIYAMLATEKFLFTASADKKVRQYEIAGGKLLRAFEGHDQGIFAIAYHEESGSLAAGSYDGTVRIWNAGNGELKAEFVAAPGWTETKVGSGAR